MKKNQMIIKILIITIILIIGTVFNIYFSTFIHEILSKEVQNLVIPKLGDAIMSLKVNRNHLNLFLVFQLTIILGSILYFATNKRPYQSDLIKITPNIMTPASAGQRQFGSARWMKEEEKDNAFSTCVLKKNDKLISYLIKHGYDDIENEKAGDKYI